MPLLAAGGKEGLCLRLCGFLRMPTVASADVAAVAAVMVHMLGRLFSPLPLPFLLPVAPFPSLQLCFSFPAPKLSLSAAKCPLTTPILPLTASMFPFPASVRTLVAAVLPLQIMVIAITLVMMAMTAAASTAVVVVLPFRLAATSVPAVLPSATPVFVAVMAVAVPAVALQILRKFSLLTGLVRAMVMTAVTNAARRVIGAARVGAVVVLTDTLFGHLGIAVMVSWSPFTPTGRAVAVPA
ncbi:hypothetical protein Vafri_1030 [Volvox africanus]|nr:hypothetical protein Vafri_1030 [Volvox africanus]